MCLNRAIEPILIMELSELYLPVSEVWNSEQVIPIQSIHLLLHARIAIWHQLREEPAVIHFLLKETSVGVMYLVATMQAQFHLQQHQDTGNRPGMKLNCFLTI